MGTLLVNLEHPVEVLWKRVEKDCRRTIRRTNEKGIEIETVSNLDDLKEFHDLNAQMGKRAQQKVYPFSYFASLWNYFSPLDKAVVFLARIKDKPVGTSFFLIHNKTIHIIAMGDSDYARINRIYALYPIFWHAIKWGHERGLKYFDITGVELHKIDAGNKKAQNIYRFKSKWGGQLMEYHDYEKPLQKQKLINFLNHFMVDSVIHN
jgi:lipid II:glycine glycyltransferase (peptidoglycan interpeptide bridge formation enzyme)